MACKVIGTRQTQAQKSYDDAFGEFASGRGNVIRQAEMLKELEIKPRKHLPSEMVEALENETPEIAL